MKYYNFIILFNVKEYIG